MASELTATATISFSPTPSVQLMSASSTIVETLTTKSFQRWIGGADTASNQLSLAADDYAIVGGTPSWLWVKNIDTTNPIRIHVVNDDRVTGSHLEICSLVPGEAILLKIGRGTDIDGNFVGVANYVIVGSGATLYDAVLMAT